MNLGAGQSWNASEYERHAAFVPALGAAAFDLLAPVAGERILDVGCGDGVLTQRIARSNAIVTGIDASPELIAAAVARGIDARLGDAQRLDYDGEFDAVFSNAALHWMRDADAVIAGVRRALRPGGRFAGEFGGHGNVAAICTALVAALRAEGIDARDRFPWFFPTAAEYRADLERHGFMVETISLIPRPTPLPTGLAGWLATFAEPFFTGLEPARRERVLASATALVAPFLCDRAGNWTADYVRLRFKAVLPA